MRRAAVRQPERPPSYVLYCFVFFYLAFAGGGAWSLDALWRRSGDTMALERD